MGEILRAVLEQNSVASRPRWYAGHMRIAAPAGLPVTRSTVTQFDRGGYFLMTSFYVGNGVNVTPFGFQGLKNNAMPMDLQDPDSGKSYFQSQLGAIPNLGPPGMNVGSRQSSPTEMYEYLVFEPSQRLKWTVTMNPGFYGNGVLVNFDICYAGIEYLMPASGVPNVTPPQ